MKSLALFISLFLSLHANADFAVTPELQDKIVNQGVPRASLLRILDWMSGKYGMSSAQKVYKCAGRDETNLRPCSYDRRTYFIKDMALAPRRYAVSVDFSLPSTTPRFFFMDLETGDVSKEYVTHGKGSGELYAERFSNVLNSNMTSIGMYLVGEIYVGDHGQTLRLHGLESSNDESYNRDIVLHSAIYADPSFIEKINPRTGKKYGRLGLSEGCPAVTEAAMKKYLPYLRAGALFDHYHQNFIP